LPLHKVSIDVAYWKRSSVWGTLWLLVWYVQVTLFRWKSRKFCC